MREKEIISQIDRYLKGLLSEKEKDALWSEFLEHPEYLDWLEIEVNARDYFQNDNEDHPAAVSETSSAGWQLTGYRYRIVAAATALLILGGLIFFIVYSGGVIESPAVASIDIQEMITPDFSRSADPAFDPLDTAINAGFESAVSGRIDESLLHFDTVLQGNPTALQEATTSFNKAILLYNQREFETAAELLRRTAEINTDSGLTEKALWYLANALVRIGDSSAAYSALLDVISREGVHQGDARNLLERLDPS